MKPKSVSSEDVLEKDINSLSKKELKLVWDNFKNNNLGLIETYFNSKVDQLRTLDNNSILNILYDMNDSSKTPRLLSMFKDFWSKLVS